MEYIPVRVSTFRGDQPTQFDVFVRINEKYILYVRRGDNFKGERLKRLRAKKLRKMYILAESEVDYIGYLEGNINTAYNSNSSMDMATRAEVIQGAQEANVEEVFENPDNQTAYNAAKIGAGKYVDFLSASPEGLATMLALTTEEPTLAHHGVTIATLAIGLAQRLNKDIEAEQLQALTLGALLHDIGHTDQPYNWNQPLEKMSPEHLALYKGHAERGAKKVEDKPFFDPRVAAIIGQHHEFIDGTGFPQKLMQKNTDPLAVIVSVCESYERLSQINGLSRREALTQLTVNRVGQHPLNYIQELQNLIKTMK